MQGEEVGEYKQEGKDQEGAVEWESGKLFQAVEAIEFFAGAA